MSQRENILTPVGRLVQGSLYDPNTTDAENKPLVIKTGAQAGQPRVDFFFALAIPKGPEKHWAETSWGQKIWTVGQAGFPQGQANALTFAWKIKDGDSNIPNRVGKKPCDQEGFPGHWILNFSSSFAPSIVNEDGSAYILDKDFVSLGDYIQVAGSVADNGSLQQPGVFLNHSHVAFVRYGKRIIVGVDPKTIGFGQNTVIPAGASLTPLGQGALPQDVRTPMGNALVAPPIQTTQIAPPPHTAILTPPSPVPVRVMLPAAAGSTYEQFIAAGWTDQLLIQHGMMQA